VGRDAPGRVAIDAAPLLDPQTGVGRYVNELARALEAHGIELRRYAVSFSGRSDGSIKRWRVPARIAQEAWYRFEAPSIRRLIGQVDVLHATNFVLPPGPAAANVVTVHDLGFFRSDTFPGGHRLQDLVPWSLRRAHCVITPTRAIAQEVAERFAVDEERLVATHLGVSPVFFGATPLGDRALDALGITPPFAVAVATLQPRKNLHRLLEAWERARREMPGWSLVLAGPKGWGPELPKMEGVVPIGWVGDETLPGVLAAADMFCYPSLYEGFGLPPLEAMATGTAALVGRYSAASEVLGDDAVFVDPLDVDDIARGLIELATDEGSRKRLERAGRIRASGYTWERTASSTLRAYEVAARFRER